MKQIYLKSLLLVAQLPLLSAYAQWTQVGSDTVSARSLVVSGTIILAGGKKGVFVSTNSGTSWTAVNTGLTNLDVTSLVFSGTNLFAGTLGGGVFLSTNTGANWTSANTGLTNSTVWSVGVSALNILAGTEAGGIFLSTNNGVSWTRTALDTVSVYSFAVLGTNLFAGCGYDVRITRAFGIYRSTNNGSSWAPTALDSVGISTLALSGQTLIAASVLRDVKWSNGGIYFSTDNGASWTHSNMDTATYILALAPSGSNLFAGGTSIYAAGSPGGGVFLTTNNGTNWTAVNTGMTNNSVYSLAISGTNLFAGTDSGVWRRQLSELTSAEELANELPTRFTLHPNYPNPFNPTTTISFDIPARSFVSLRIFDLLGREVSNLVSEELPAGTFSRRWANIQHPTGVYLCRLEAGTFIQTRKLVLLR